jgi:hypothetical protein
MSRAKVVFDEFRQGGGAKTTAEVAQGMIASPEKKGRSSNSSSTHANSSVSNNSSASSK